MKKVIKQFACMAMLAAPFAHADSLLRVTCTDDESDAVVSIDTTAVGTCPVITAMPAGTYQVRVVKAVGADKEQVFEKQVTLVDGRPQSIDAELSAPQLTARAIQAQAKAKLEKTLAAARSGDIAAMNTVADLYAAGDGVPKDPVQAGQWRAKGAQAQAKAQQDQFYTFQQGANNGDVSAMYQVASAYERGEGVTQDRAQAAMWRQRAKDTGLQQRLNAEGFFNDLKHYKFDDPGMFTSSTTFVPTSIFIGVIESPSVTSKQMRIGAEAAMRPGSFANPDSMIARAMKRQDVVLAGQ